MKKQFFLFVLLLALARAISAQPVTNEIPTRKATYKPKMNMWVFHETDKYKLYSHETISQKQQHKSTSDSLKTKQTVGVAIDLLPPIMSAATGNFGYSAQLWYGYKKFRVRGVIAGFQMPDKLMGNESFTKLKTTATALIFDYFVKNNFKGWWFGAGIERWNNTITAKTANRDYSFNNNVATAGSGYIVKVYKNLYVEPWGAVHCVLNNEKVAAGTAEYQSKKFQGEVSIKVGWHF